MSRNAEQWNERPAFPDTHYVSTEIYTDETLFKEEQAKIFNKCWIIACHESELVNPYDYRTFSHPGGAPLIVIRGEDMKVRSFYNICPHRGNTLLYDPVGNAKRITCIFHAWSFNAKGDCIDVSRGRKCISFTASATLSGFGRARRSARVPSNPLTPSASTTTSACTSPSCRSVRTPITLP